MRVTTLLAVFLGLALSACDESTSGDDVSGVSATESKALNDAAEMLDRRPASPAAVGNATS